MTHPRVPRPLSAMEVAFLSSVQGYQTDREREIAERLRAERPDVTVRILSPDETTSLLPKYKLKFGPAVVIDGRLEFVGIPRYRMLLERIEIAKHRSTAPPPAAVAGAAPAPAAPTPPAKPAGPTP